MEKACLAVVFFTQKLCHYMLGHMVHLISNIYPLKYTLTKISLIGHLAKWVMLLNKFDIEYVEQKAIKCQAIADHLVDAPLIDAYPLVMEFPDEHICLIVEQTPWKLYFDGSYTSHGSRVGILYTSR